MLNELVVYRQASQLLRLRLPCMSDWEEEEEKGEGQSAATINIALLERDSESKEFTEIKEELKTENRKHGEKKKQ